MDSEGDKLAALARLPGVKIGNAALYQEALTHGSTITQRSGGRDYQRLEFLGDRVLGLSIAEALYTRHPQMDEGAMSARLNILVSRARCAEVARGLGLGAHIRLGKQARDDGGYLSDNILGDVVEALIGATFIDQGFDGARALVLTWWQDLIDDSHGDARHPKSALLEWAAAQRKRPPVFSVVSRDGPDHAPHFRVRVEVGGYDAAEGEGSSKQAAERAAAAAMLHKLGLMK